MNADSTSITFLVMLSPFIAAVFAPALTRLLNYHAAWFLALVPAWIFIHFAVLSGEVSAGNPVTGGFQWVPSFNVTSITHRLFAG